MIATQDDLISARTLRRQAFAVQKASIANMAAGNLCSLWRSSGPLPPQAAIPGAAAQCTKALTGAFKFNNPSGADRTYVDSLDINSSVAGRIVLADRLVHSGGLNGTLTTAQAVNTPAIPRGLTTGEDVEWFLEWYADTGSTAVTATVTYTDQAGTGGRTTTVSVPATCRAGRLLPIVPAAGDTGIQSVQSVQLSATTGTAGNFGVTCLRRLKGCSVAVVAASLPGPGREAVLEEVPNDACLMLLVECNTTSSGLVTGELVLIQG